MESETVQFRGVWLMNIRIIWPIVMALILAGLTSCSGSSANSQTSRESTSIDRCRDRSGGGVSHDDAREAHHGGQPDGAYRTASYGSRSAADRPPEWWGRSDVDPCSTDDDLPSLSGPLLLDSTQPEDDIDDDDDEPVDPASDL